MLEICKICHKEIKTKDNYVRLTDYQKGEFLLEFFYHTLCYTNQIKGFNPQQKVAMKLLKDASSILNKVQGKPNEVYQI